MSVAAPPRAPFGRTAAVLWLLGIAGAAAAMPCVGRLESKVLAARAAKLHLTTIQIYAIGIGEAALLIAVAVLLGLFAARKVGLGVPLIGALVSGQGLPKNWFATLILALIAGAAAGWALLGIDKSVFAPMPSVAALIAKAASGATHPEPWQGVLASFYGAFDEEILVRLGLLSLLALGLRALTRGGGKPLSGGVFWTANIVSAVLFGLGHLPATAALAPLTPALIVRAVTMNGAAGLLFGWFYRRFGLEWAMASHFGCDLILHVLAG